MKYPYSLALLLLTFTVNQALAQSPDSIAAKSELDVRFQSLWMARTYDGESNFDPNTNFYEWSHSTALTVNYKSKPFYDFSVGLQYLGAFAVIDDDNNTLDSSYSNGSLSLSNSAINVLNKMYLQYDFQLGNFRSGNITAGRKSIKGNFSPNYNLRQRDQAFEAIELNLLLDSFTNLSAGHIYRFSDWKPWTEQQTMQEIYGLEKGQAGVQFFQLDRIGKGKINYEFYNFFAQDLFNTIGLHLQWNFYKTKTLQFSINPNYVNQVAIGQLKADTNHVLTQSNVLQFGIKTAASKWSAEVGFLQTFGQPEENTLETPFQSTLIGKEPLYEIDLGTKGGSHSYYLESSLALDKVSCYALFILTDLYDERQVHEIDFIGRYKLNTRFDLSLKVGMAHYDFKSFGTNTVMDYRLFVGYNL